MVEVVSMYRWEGNFELWYSNTSREQARNSCVMMYTKYDTIDFETITRPTQLL